MNLDLLENEIGTQQDVTTETPWSDALHKGTVTLTEAGALALPKREAIIAPFFLEGDLAFIYAPRGVGKTWYSMSMGLAIAEGKPFGPWKTAKARRVLYVDGEMAWDASLARAHQLMPVTTDNFILAHHEAIFHLTGKVLNLTSPDAQAALTAECLRRQIEVLILDNLSCLFSIKENEADSWGTHVLPWLLELRRRRIAVIFVHHAGRNGQMRGTSKREDAAFWSIKLSEAKGDDDALGATFIASFDKNRNSTASDAPNLLWRFTPQNDGSVLTEFQTLTPQDIFVGLVRDGLTSCSDIAQEMNYTKGAVSKLAKRAEKAGLITNKDGKYAPRG